MKSLFNEYGNHTEESRKLSEELHSALRGVMEEWAEKDFSIREICYLALEEAHSVTAHYQLNKGLKIYQAKKEEMQKRLEERKKQND